MGVVFVPIVMRKAEEDYEPKKCKKKCLCTVVPDGIQCSGRTGTDDRSVFCGTGEVVTEEDKAYTMAAVEGTRANLEAIDAVIDSICKRLEHSENDRVESGDSATGSI